MDDKHAGPEHPKPATLAKVSLLRWVAMASFAALFVTDYAIDAWAKPVPDWAYVVLGAVSVGVEIPLIRELLLAVVRKSAGLEDDKKK